LYNKKANELDLKEGIIKIKVNTCILGWVEFPLISQIENIGCGKVATSNEKQNPKRNFEIG